jgi:hypothetical protein
MQLVTLLSISESLFNWFTICEILHAFQAHDYIKNEIVSRLKIMIQQRSNEIMNDLFSMIF